MDIWLCIVTLKQCYVMMFTGRARLWRHLSRTLWTSWSATFVIMRSRTFMAPTPAFIQTLSIRDVWSVCHAASIPCWEASARETLMLLSSVSDTSYSWNVLVYNEIYWTNFFWRVLLVHAHNDIMSVIECCHPLWFGFRTLKETIIILNCSLGALEIN